MIHAVAERADFGIGAERQDQTDILYTKDFYLEFLDRIPTASERVLLTTMAYKSDEISDPILSAMTEKTANSDDVRVAFQADSLVYLTNTRNMPDWWIPEPFAKERTARLDRVHQRINDLTDAGGEFRWLNSPNLRKKVVPLWDINHLKVGIVDDTVYLSGPNIGEKNIWHTTDTVARITDKALADTLEDLLFSGRSLVVESPIHVEGIGTVVIDDGRRKASLINRMAERLIAASSKEVLMAAKTRPDTNLHNALHQAVSNGADVDYVHNSVSAYNPSQRAANYIVKRRTPIGSAVRTQSQSSRDNYGYIHSTILTTDDAAVVTTSTFLKICEQAHMQEIAFFTKNPELVERARSLFRMMFQRDEVIDDIPQCHGSQ